MPSPSEPGMSLLAADVAALHSNRTQAHLGLSAKFDASSTTLDHLREGGGYRIKFPHAGRGLEAVIVNTGGGLLGGDRLTLEIEAQADADLMITSQSAEKVYRAAGAASEIEVNLEVCEGARLHWLPMETILFSGARFNRRITADVAADGELLIAEMTVFGRIAMGERMGPGRLGDIWRIRRAGRLVFADNLVLDGDIGALLDRPAVTGGQPAVAGLLLVSPRAESLVETARDLLTDAGIDAGVSAWNGMLCARLMSSDPARLRTSFATLTAALGGRETPRFW